MKKMKSWYYKMAAMCTSVLSLALVVCANTNSCCLIHQRETPDDLNRFSKIK